MKHKDSVVRFRTGFDPHFWAETEVKPYSYSAKGKRFYAHAQPHDEASRRLDLGLTQRRNMQFGTVWLGGLDDPYPPQEKRGRVTHLVYEVVAKHQWGILVFTRSAQLLRDIDLLQEINQAGGATVGVPIPSLTASRLRVLEPGATKLGERLELLSRVYSAGLHAGIVVPEIVPDQNGSEKELKSLFRFASENACRFLLIPPQSRAVHKQYGKRLVELSAEYRVPLRIRRHLPRDYRRENFRVAGWIANSAYYKMLRGEQYQTLHQLAKFVNHLPVDVRNLVKSEETRKEVGLTEEWFETLNGFYATNHDTRLPQTV